MSGLLLEKVRIDGVEDVHRLLDGPTSTCGPLGPSLPPGTLLLASLGDIFLRTGELSMDARGRAAFEGDNRILLEMKLDSESRLFSFRSGKDVLAGEVYVVCPGDVTDYRLTGRLSFAFLSVTVDFLLR